MAHLFLCGFKHKIPMKKSILYGFLVVSLLIATPVASVFATTVSSSNTNNGYSNTVSVSGTYSNHIVSGFSWSTSATCTSGSNNCGSSNYYLQFHWLYYWISGGIEYCVITCAGRYAVAISSSTTSISQTATPNGSPTASEVLNEGQSGYYYSSTGTYYNETALIDAGIPYY